MRHLELIADGLVAAVKTHVGAALAPVLARLNELGAALKAIPAGKDGAPGERGQNGERGEKGMDGAPGAAGERGQDGAPGPQGPQGSAGDRGADGQPGAPGIDGKSMTPADVEALLAPLVSKWALDFERRAQDVFSAAIERMPKAKDGADGLSVDDMTLTDDGDGNVTFAFARGDLRKEFAIRLPRFKDAGVYQPAGVYRKGDGVTWGGSFAIAQVDNPEGKPGESNDWRIAVKRGRDGKDAAPVIKPEPVRLA